MLLVAALAATSAIPAQAPEDPQPSGATDRDATQSDRKPASFIERTRVELALIEAVITDRRGRHVRGLTRDAFRLLADGEEIPIVSFDEIDLTPREAGAGEPAPATTPGEPAPRPADPGTPAPVPPAEGEAPAVAVPPTALPDAASTRGAVEARMQGPRWFIMLFDGYNNISPLRMNQARRSAKKWVSNNLREQDMVAVYEMTPYLMSISGFTSDRWEIKDSIDKARIFPASQMGQDIVEQKLEQGRTYSRDFLEDQLLNVGTFGADLLRAERDQFYLSVASIAEVMAGLDGTKAVLLFSGGFPMTRTRSTAARGGFTTRFKHMLRELERHGIRVFSYDVGVEGGFTDASEASNFRIALDELGFGTEWMDDLQIGAQIDSTNAHQEILHVLGSETGGRFWRSRDFGQGLQAADDDLSHYYLIGYRPSASAKKRGGYTRLKLKPLQGNLKVIAREGRVEDDEETERREAARLAAEAVREAQRAGASLELSCRPLYYPADNGQTLVVLPVRAGGPVRAEETEDGKLELELDVTISAGIAGEIVAQGTRNIRLTLPAGAARQLEHGLQLREAIVLPPTLLDLTVDLKLNGSGRGGRWEASARVPERKGDTFGLSDVTLLYPTDPTPLVYDVFRKGDDVFGTEPPSKLRDPLGADASGRPPVYLGGGFKRLVPLLVQVQVTSPPPPSETQQSPLRMDWELIPASGAAAIAPPLQYRRLQMLDEGRLLDVLVDLDLSSVAPGEYSLRLTAENLVDQSRVARSYPITVTP